MNIDRRRKSVSRLLDRYVSELQKERSHRDGLERLGTASRDADAHNLAEISNRLKQVVMVTLILDFLFVAIPSIVRHVRWFSVKRISWKLLELKSSSLKASCPSAGFDVINNLMYCFVARRNIFSTSCVEIFLNWKRKLLFISFHLWGDAFNHLFNNSCHVTMVLTS